MAICQRGPGVRSVNEGSRSSPRDTEIAALPKLSADANPIDAGPGGAAQDGLGGNSLPGAFLLPVAIDDDAYLAPSGGRNGLTPLPDRSGGRPSVALTAAHAVPDHAVWPQFRASPMAGMSSQRSSHQRFLSRHRTRADRRESSCREAASPTDSSRKSESREKMHSPRFLGQTRSPSSEGDARLACSPLAPSVLAQRISPPAGGGDRHHQEDRYNQWSTWHSTAWRSAVL